MAIVSPASDDPLIERLDGTWSTRTSTRSPRCGCGPTSPACTVAYTAMHGVGGADVVRAFEAAGFDPPVVVAEQHEPDGAFPTVSFPNPEEPGAMDLLLAVARTVGADVALANDPDADRLGAAIPSPTVVAAPERRRDRVAARRSHARQHDRRRPPRGHHARVVVVAWQDGRGRRRALRGDVHRVQVDRPDRAPNNPSLRFVLGYEQALGYLVAHRPLDKDGITAAVLIAEIAAVAQADGVTLQDRLDAIADRFGRYVTAELSVRLTPARRRRGVAALEADPPAEVGGRAVTSVATYPEAGLVRLCSRVASGSRSARAAPSRR